MTQRTLCICYSNAILVRKYAQCLNRQWKQPSPPQKQCNNSSPEDLTTCGGITDVDTNALISEEDAQCVESYAVALRFFSHSMGRTGIDEAILERPPSNELLEKLKQYQKMIAMARAMREAIETFIPLVTPFNFFYMYSVGTMDIPRKQKVFFDDACAYLFDLGLTEDILVQYSARLRCCGVMYLIRRILNRHCSYLPDHQEYHTQRTRCPCCTLTDWSELLTVMTGVEDNLVLRKVAFIYCSTLCRARKFVTDPEHAYPYRAAFDKANRPEMHHVSSSRLLTHFQMGLLFPAACA
ncbi:unnamed protein product [Hydatigera taeniaeformis]|uniref:FLZ-type domain-containing protein n=1 Tax=Hydatigena taeniaeformis TaxID=6205 RepID=A0A0R3WI47_HYDTA|nr:unnamed protein product [Hydatigera taeniaeformis]